MVDRSYREEHQLLANRFRVGRLHDRLLEKYLLPLPPRPLHHVAGGSMCQFISVYTTRESLASLVEGYSRFDRSLDLDNNTMGSTKRTDLLLSLDYGRYTLVGGGGELLLIRLETLLKPDESTTEVQ